MPTTQPTLHVSSVSPSLVGGQKSNLLLTSLSIKLLCTPVSSLNSTILRLSALVTLAIFRSQLSSHSCSLCCCSSVSAKVSVRYRHAGVTRVLMTLLFSSFRDPPVRHHSLNCSPRVRFYMHKLLLCLPWSVQANCTNVAAARLMSKLLTMNSGYRSWYRANFIAVWYARQAIQKRSLRYI